MRRLLLPLLLLMGLSTGARAELLVLVHGYLGSATSWETSGVVATLESRGWRRAGLLAGPRLLPAAGLEAERKVFTVELPSIAPLLVQAEELQRMLGGLAARYPGEPIHLVGHSAGGVVARAVLVRGGAPSVQTLVTIASPHLGTGRALQAIDASDTPWPFCIIDNFFSDGLTGTLRDSRGLLLDLRPAQPGSLLHWLNAQPHPEIAYHSVVRSGPVGLGDELVPVFSQDMNSIAALRGRSARQVALSGHALHPQDGAVLAAILAKGE